LRGCTDELCGVNFSSCSSTATNDTKVIVHCDANGDVVGLNLDERGLMGFVGTELQTLTKLHRSDNFIFGTLPTSLLSLSELLDVNVKNNSLVGNVLHLLQLPKLQRLQAYSNFFDDRIENLTVAVNSSLEILSVQDNEVSGELLSSQLALLSRLTYLHAGSNQIRGDLGSPFYTLTQLQRLKPLQKSSDWNAIERNWDLHENRFDRGTCVMSLFLRRRSRNDAY
jgi:hypothetical protein